MGTPIGLESIYNTLRYSMTDCSTQIFEAKVKLQDTLLAKFRQHKIDSFLRLALKDLLSMSAKRGRPSDYEYSRLRDLIITCIRENEDETEETTDNNQDD
jgi:hypothetical protein